MKTGEVLKVEEKNITAAGVVAEDEDFFQDHFPGFPVVPGVMILEIFKKTAEKYFKNEDADFFLQEVRNVKFSNYLRPGDSWRADLELVSREGDLSEWKARLMNPERTACSAQFKLLMKRRRN